MTIRSGYSCTVFVLVLLDSLVLVLLLLLGTDILGYYSRTFVRQFLCVNFAYANSHVHEAIDKTFIRKKNSKFVCKYTHGLSCCTIEIFRKCRRSLSSPCLVLKLNR